MTNEAYFEVHENDTPLQLLSALIETESNRRSDAVQLNDAKWRRNDEEAAYWDSEGKHMLNRAFWVYNKLCRVLTVLEPARVIPVNWITWEWFKTCNRHVWMEIRKGVYCGDLDRYYGGKPYQALISSAKDTYSVDGEARIGCLYVDGGYESLFNIYDYNCGKVYGRDWRLWTAKPTKEQQEAEPWNS